MSQRYKGRLIDPHPYERDDGSGWSVEVYIAEDMGNETIDTQYLIQGIFPTREAAVQAAVTSGIRVIDKLIRSRDVQTVIDSEARLPSTYRHGLGHATDDVAEASVKVAGPDNPKDCYK